MIELTKASRQESYTENGTLTNTCKYTLKLIHNIQFTYIFIIHNVLCL